jgi:hypothetical protein
MTKEANNNNNKKGGGQHRTIGEAKKCHFFNAPKFNPNGHLKFKCHFIKKQNNATTKKMAKMPLKPLTKKRQKNAIKVAFFRHFF